VTFRLLDPATEWQLLPQPLPMPELALIVGAVTDSGEIVGYAIVQLVPHLEPVVCSDPTVLRGLIRSAEQEICNRFTQALYFSCATSESVEKICEAMHMRRIHGVFTKFITSPTAFVHPV
jgi:hypothetical protein